VKDVLDCQNKCRQQSWCKKFEYNVFTHMCHFMRSWPAKGTPVSGDYLISGPPQCLGHVAFNMTVENVDFEKLNKDPTLLHLFKDTVIKATVRNPNGNQTSEDGEVLVHVSKGSTSSKHWHELFTEKWVDRAHRYQQRNASVIVSVAVYAEGGINFATAKMVTTGRFKLATKVTQHLRMLQSLFTPVMSTGSEMFISAVSPIRAIGQDGKYLDSIVQMADEAVHVAWPEILAKVGGRLDLVSSVCLLTALAVCIGMFVALMQLKARSRQRYTPFVDRTPLTVPTFQE